MPPLPHNDSRSRRVSAVRTAMPSLGLGQPSNRRHRPSPLDPLSAGAARAKTWVIDRTPAQLRQRMPELSRVRRVLRRVGAVALSLYVVLVAGSLVRSFVVEGRYHDRSEELRRMEGQLAEERSRTERLRSQQAALARRADVQVDAIRRELNMLRQGERFYVFH